VADLVDRLGKHALPSYSHYECVGDAMHDLVRENMTRQMTPEFDNGYSDAATACKQVNNMLRSAATCAD
jgi:hypothetical protein